MKWYHPWSRASWVSILIASGDNGVASAGDQCVSNDGKNIPMFVPGFPNSCQYVTAVGATSGIPERGIALSGGGFSNYFPRPKYQETVVNQ